MIPPYESPLRKAGTSNPLSFSTIFKGWWGAAILLLAGFVFFLPVCRLVWLSLFSEGTLSLKLYREVLTERATWQAIKNTLWITVFSTMLSVVLGTALAWVMAYVNVRGKRWMQLLIFLPFIIPSYITTLAWVEFFGQNALFGADDRQVLDLYSLQGIIFVLGLSHYPLVYLLSVEVFRKIPRELEHAARASGASKWTVFRRVVFPMALPGIAGGGLLAFLSNLDNFGIPAILGIPANIRVLSTYIYEQVIGYGPSAFAKASVLSVLLGLAALAATAAQWFIVRKGRVADSAARDLEPRVILSANHLMGVEILLWSFLVLTSLIPFLAMASTSLIKAYGLTFSWENLSLENYQYLLLEDPKTMRAVVNSAGLALFAMMGCLVLGTAIAYLRYKSPSIYVRLAEMMVTIPYALPGTILALAVILMWLQPLPGWKPGVYGTVWILWIAYMTRFSVLQVRGSFAAFAQLDPSMEEAARTAGARMFEKWKKILLPQLFPGIMGGALLVFLSALTELTVSSLLWSSGSETIGVVIFSFEQAGYSQYSTAFSSLVVLAILLSAVLFLVCERAWKKRVLKSND